MNKIENHSTMLVLTKVYECKACLGILYPLIYIYYIICLLKHKNETTRKVNFSYANIYLIEHFIKITTSSHLTP